MVRCFKTHDWSNKEYHYSSESMELLHNHETSDFLPLAEDLWQDKDSSDCLENGEHVEIILRLWELEVE